MSGRARGLTLAGLALVVVIATIALYRDHRAEVARQGQREEPVIAASRVERAAGPPRVVLDSSDAERIGLHTAPLESAGGGEQVQLVAEILQEPERAATVRAPVAGRLTAPQGRWPRLGDVVRAGSPLAQVSDARPLTAPLSGTVTEVSARPGEIVELGQSLLRITDLSHPMIRVVWSDRAGSRPPRAISVAASPSAHPVPARLIGPAAEADPVTRQPAYLYRAERSWPGATPGTLAVALVSAGSGGAAGVLVPDRAVVQWDGLAWAYVQRAAGTFERVRVPTDHPASGSWIAGAPLVPGDRVVVVGAEQLLSEEFRAQVTVGDESGE
jgi:biotin carboxyl carrier protein